jgi:fimbrial chaperone protein
MKNLERYTGKAAVAAAFLFLLAGLPPAATASISVSPVLIELSARHGKDVVRVANASDEPKSFEINVVAWTQSEEQREIYADSGDLVAVPPLFTLEPGGEQVVRIGLMRDPDPETERAYRVFITELAPPEDEARAQSGINMRLRFGVPVFVAPLADGVKAIDFTGLDSIGGHTFMKLANSGNIRVKITEIRYRSPLEEESATSTASFYLHPGKSGLLPLAFPDLNAGGTIELVTDTAGILEYVLAGNH